MHSYHGLRTLQMLFKMINLSVHCYLVSKLMRATRQNIFRMKLLVLIMMLMIIVRFCFKARRLVRNCLLAVTVINLRLRNCPKYLLMDGPIGREPLSVPSRLKVLRIQISHIRSIMKVTFWPFCPYGTITSVLSGHYRYLNSSISCKRVIKISYPALTR